MSSDSEVVVVREDCSAADLVRALVAKAEGKTVKVVKKEASE